MKKICVLLSTYNGEKYVKKQIDSILSQSGNFSIQILVRDDGSSDDTVNILKSYSNKINAIYGKNVGWMKSFSILLFASKMCQDVDYFAFADQDDIWFPNKIHSALKLLETYQNDRPLLYGSQVIEVDENLKEINHKKYIPNYEFSGLNVMFYSFALGCTMVFNKFARDIFIQSKKNMRCVGHDWLLATLCAYTGTLIYDSNAYIYHIRHKNNCSGNLSLENAIKSKIKQFKNNKIGYSVYEEIYNGYMDYLPNEDKKIIDDFMIYKKNIAAKLRLVFNPRVKKISFKGTMILKLSILLNKHV